MPIQVNITTRVNNAKIRREQHNGRDHIVLPSYTLPANVVMNGGLYTAEEIDKHYPTLEGTLAPLGHPQVNGEFVSAFSPEGINAGHIGAWNRNVKKAGNRIYLEKWVDVEVASRTEQGQEFLERVEAIEKGEDVPPIHTSVAAFLEMAEASEAQQSQGAEWVAKISRFDHDAILLNEVGAATPEQGVGLMVNADTAQPVTANADALVGESYRQREERIRQAAMARFGTNPDSYVWVADFTDDQAIITVDGKASVYGYTVEAGKVVLSDAGEPVERQESWVTMAANKIKRIFNPQARPATNRKEGEMPMTPEERAELVRDIGEAVTANMTEQLAPITQQIEALQANQQALSDSLTANAKAEEAEKRKAVAAKLGEVVANALTGEALDAAFATLGDAAPLAPNSASEGPETGAPDPVAYFGGAQ